MSSARSAALTKNKSYKSKPIRDEVRPISTSRNFFQEFPVSIVQFVEVHKEPKIKKKKK